MKIDHTNPITFHSVVEYELALKYFSLNNFYPLPEFNYIGALQKNELHVKLNDYLRNFSFDRKELITYLKAHIESHMVTSSDLPWLDKSNARLCFYIWFLCCQTDGDINTHPHSLAPLILDTPYSNLYSSIALHNLTPTSESCHTEILNFISILNIPKQIKLNYLNNLYQTHLNILEFSSMSWMNDKVDNAWAIKYLKDSLIGHVPLSLVNYFNQVNNSGPIDYLILIFDSTLTLSPLEKYKLMTRFKKAWNQKLHRDKLNSNKRKAYQFVLTQDMQEKLDIIKMKWEENLNKNQQLDKVIVTKNQIVEDLIQSEFLRLMTNE